MYMLRYWGRKGLMSANCSEWPQENKTVDGQVEEYTGEFITDEKSVIKCQWYNLCWTQVCYNCFHIFYSLKILIMKYRMGGDREKTSRCLWFTVSHNWPFSLHVHVAPGKPEVWGQCSQSRRGGAEAGDKGGGGSGQPGLNHRHGATGKYTWRGL